MLFIILINPNQFLVGISFMAITKNMNSQNGNTKEKLCFLPNIRLRADCCAGCSAWKVKGALSASPSVWCGRFPLSSSV